MNPTLSSIMEEFPADTSDEEDILWPPAPNVEPMITSIIDEDETDPGNGETKRPNPLTDGSTPWTDAWIDDRAKGQDEINALVAKGHYTPSHLLLPRVNTPPPAPVSSPTPVPSPTPMPSPTPAPSSPTPAPPPTPLVVPQAQTIPIDCDCCSACCGEDSSDYEKALARPAREEVRYFAESTWAVENGLESPHRVNLHDLPFNQYIPPEGQFLPPNVGLNPFSGPLYAPMFPLEPARSAPVQRTIDPSRLMDSNYVSQPENLNSWDPSMQPRPEYRFWGNPFRHAPRPVSQTFRPPRDPPLRRQPPMNLPLCPPIVLPDPAPPPNPSYVVATTDPPPAAAQESPGEPVSSRLRIRQAPAALDPRHLFPPPKRVAEVPFPTREPLLPSPMLGTGSTEQIFPAPGVADVPFPTQESPKASPVPDTGSTEQTFPTPEAPHFVSKVGSPPTEEVLADSPDCQWLTSKIGEDVKIVCKRCLIDKITKQQDDLPCDRYWLNYYMRNEPLKLYPFFYRTTARAMADRCKALRRSKHGWKPAIDFVVRDAVEILDVFAERDAEVSRSVVEEYGHAMGMYSEE